MKNMITRISLLGLAMSLLLPCVVLAAAAEEPGVHDQMELMGKSMRQLGRQCADPAQKESSLELATKILGYAQKARTLTPDEAEKLKGEEQTKYVATFQKGLDELIVELGVLKTNIAEGKADVIKAQIDKIMKLKATNHKALGVDKHDHGHDHKH